MSNIKCFKWGKMGHFQSKCPENKENKPKKKPSEKGMDAVLMTMCGLTKVENTIWIADSGASTHITTMDVGLFNVRSVNVPVQIGNSKLVYATKIGKLTIKYQNKKGEEALLLLKNIQYIPGFSSNLFSLTVALTKNCLIYNQGRAIIVEKDLLCIEFNKEIRTQNGYVCGTHLTIKKNDLALTMTMIEKKCDVQVVHNMLGHVCKAMVWESAKFYG